MKWSHKIVLVFLLISLSSAHVNNRLDFRRARNNNVCKVLRGKALVYFVFVDSKGTAPWTEFDIRSTLDSMSVAINWIKQQARKNNVNLNLSSDYFIGAEYTTIKRNLEYATVYNTATTPNLKKGYYALNKWGDGIASLIGKEVHITSKDGIPEIKNPKNKERLVAHLRDENQLENICLLFLVNNYYQDDISITLNHFDNEDVEFSIISYKYPSVIAQNILTLFGAADLNKTIYRRNHKKIKMAAKFFPNDIMQDGYGKNMDEMEIGEFTQYLIGWRSELNPKYHSLLTDNLTGL